LNSLFDSKMNVSSGAQVLYKSKVFTSKQCPKCLPEFRNTHSHLLRVYLGACAKIEIVMGNPVC